MKKCFSKICSLVLALSMTFGLGTPAFAVEVEEEIDAQSVTESGDDTRVPVTLTAEEEVFSVSVPSALPVYVTQYSEVLVADGTQVVNNSGSPVSISDLQIEAKSGWTIEDYDSFESQSYTFGAKRIAMRVGSVKTTGENSTDFHEGSFNTMTSYDRDGVTNVVDLSYDVKLPVLDQEVTEPIANITFVLSWASGIIPNGYVIQAPKEIQVIDGVYQLGYGDSYQLNAVEDYGMEVGTWYSSNPEVVKVEPSTGVITAVGEGTCTIYYTKDGLSGSLPLRSRSPIP